jgi:hypothetical protein
LDDTTASNGLDTDADSDWFVSIYAGTGRGQLREVSSVSSDDRITPAEEFVTNPDTTSKYCLWPTGGGDEYENWHKITAYKLDRLEYPDKLYLTRNFPSAEGLRFRLNYVAAPSDLDADTDVTYAPREYVVYKALSLLYDSLVGHSRADRSTYAGQAQYFDELAAGYLADNQRDIPAQNLRVEEDVGGYGAMGDQEDPLGWFG